MGSRGELHALTGEPLPGSGAPALLEQMRLVLDNLPAVVFTFDTAHTCTFMGGSDLVRLGIDPGDFVGRSLADLYPDHPQLSDCVGRAFTGEELRFVLELERTWEMTLRPLTDEHGNVTSCLGVATDVTARVDAEKQLRRSESRLHALLTNISDVVALHDADGTPRWMSPSIANVLGRTGPEDVGLSDIHGRVHPEDMDRLNAAFLTWTRTAGVGAPVEYRVADGSGDWLYFESVGNNLLDDPDVGGIVVTTHNVTGRKAAEQALSRLALHDQLTGLPNRTLLLDRLGHAMDSLERRGGAVALLFLDLDGFKHVNDTFGHHAGDRLLRTVADRLTSVVRPGDTVARLGGDEFVVLCEDVATTEEAEGVAARVHAALAAPIQLDGGSTPVSASIGVALTPAADAATLLRNADTAMYRAKDLGRSRSEVFSEHLRDESVEQLRIRTELRDVLEHRDLRVHYQPVVDATTGSAVGAEALLRWQHPRHGLLPARRFVGHAEAAGYLPRFDVWVLGEVCRQVAAWAASGLDLPVSINLSPRHLVDPAFAATMRAVVEDSGVDPAMVCLEARESAFTVDTDASVRIVREVRALGVHVAVDDFGTGLSNLRQLRRFEVDAIKLDRTFVESIASDAAETAFVGAVVDLARALDMQVVAKGVERDDQAETLARLGCRFAQGNLWSAPVPADELVRRLPQAAIQR